jgi:hypothetical protein
VLSVYEATNAVLAILVGDTHAESVTRFLDELNLLTPGRSLIAPAVAKLPKPPRSNIYLDRISVPALSPSLVQAILDQDDVFALLDLNKNILWTISANRTGLFHDPADPVQKTIAQLAYTASHDVSPPPRRASRPYDPNLASRTSELVSQTVPAVEQSLIELASKWEAVLEEPAPQEIGAARKD